MAIEVRGLAPMMEVFKMRRSLAFYRDKLGFTVIGDSGNGDDSGWVMLRSGDATIMLNTQYDDGKEPAEPDPVRTKFHHDTCVYFGCPDVDAAYEHLKANDVQCRPPEIAPYGMKQLYVSDPDNYNLCFQWPVTGSKYA